MLLTGIGNTLEAQKSFSLDQVVPGGKEFSKYYPRALNASFLGSTNWVVETGRDSIFLHAQTKTLLTTRSAVSNLLKTHNARGTFSKLLWNSTTDAWAIARGAWYRINFHSGTVADSLLLLPNATGEDFEPVKGSLAFVTGPDLYLSSQGKEPVRIPTEQKEGVSYGSVAHRNEFGIHRGTFWSPNGNSLAFYRMDESMVTDYPLIQSSGRVATPKTIKYPMAGMHSHQVSVGVYQPATGTITYLQTPAEPDRYLTNVTWTPDSKNILIAELNRAQNHLKLNCYDAQSGAFLRTLYEETDEKWVEPTTPPLFNPSNPREMVWLSKKTGFNQLYRLTLDGIAAKPVTGSPMNVTELLSWSADGKFLFVQAVLNDPLQRHILQIRSTSGAVHPLTSEEGIHSAFISHSGTSLIAQYTSPTMATRTTWITETQKQVVLAKIEQPYARFQMPQMELVPLKSADGRFDLTGRLIKPVNFDPNKQYPVMVYVYGGPHSQLVNKGWLYGASSWMLYLAQQGYIVFTMDNRGTDGQSAQFEQAIHRQLGACELADQMQGIRYLQSLPFVDSSRMGVHGWSYGGFMAISLMTQYPEIFKAGVAGGPVTNWEYYEIMYGERYMDQPGENPQGYAANNLIQQVGKLKGRLLLIHGDQDPVVVPQHSLQLLQTAIDQNIPIDFFFYPGHEHNVMGPNRVHLIHKVVQYFNDHVLP